MNTAKRSFHAYKVHGHIGNHAVSDYADLWKKIAKKAESIHETESEDKVVAMPFFNLGKRYIEITVYEGEPGRAALIYDRENVRERIEDVEDNELLATRTHATIDLSSRLIVVEFNQRGAKATDIFGLLQKMAIECKGYEDLILEFVGLPGKGFTEAIDALDRITKAEVVLTKPNFDWNDCEDKIIEGVKQSGGHNARLAITPPRGEGLEKDIGLVGMIKNVTATGLSILKQAYVDGEVFGESGNVSIKNLKLNKYVEKAKLDVLISESDGLPTPFSVQTEIKRYLEKLKKSL